MCYTAYDRDQGASGRALPTEPSDGPASALIDDQRAKSCSRYRLGLAVILHSAILRLMSRVRRNGGVMAFFVNVYEIEQRYGGPEEGGWYYTAGTPVESVRVQTLAEAEQLLVRKLNRYDGKEFRADIEEHFARPFPQKRPHYE